MRFKHSFVMSLLLVFCISPTISAADEPIPDQKELKKSLDLAYDFLKSKQGADGSWVPKIDPGVTALTASALVKSGRSAEDPVVAKAMDYIIKYVKQDGGVYDKGFETYTTSLAVMAFQECNTNKKFDKVIEAAVKYLRGVQESNGTNDQELKFGGAGYNVNSRPDTSNTGFFVEALIATGTAKDDPAIKKALAFLSRAQNLPGEYNNLPFAKKATENDLGGFVYEPGGQDDEKNSKRTAGGGLRSEGGMTYAGLKSFLYAGVGKDDPRVKAAIKWVQNHYTLTENPGMGQAGLFYYYHTFAKAMAALGDDPFTDAKGGKHFWRKELFDTLKAKQATDGSWVNTDKNFMENVPELCTSFAILSLSYTIQK
jgi:hypothetical protein